MDLVGPILPASEKGHRYILTSVGYATRYPKAIPIKNIETKTVAEALLDMYIRLEIPEEVLSDVGTQFLSKCMEEDSRLLTIKRLTTTPYYPICDRLVERFNGTLKKRLKRLYVISSSTSGIVLLTLYYSHTEKRHRRPPDFHRFNYCMREQYEGQFKS